MIFFRAFSAIAASILLLSCTTSAISVDTLEINSTVLNQRIEFLVLKPTDYQKGIANGKRYPVLYLLHCAGCNHQLWLEEGYCPGLLDAVDSANFIVAIPYDGNGYGWWLNSPVVPSSQLETFIVNEFKPHIDSLYRTYTDRFNTGLAGHSMGGFGTLHLLSKYPSTFGVGYAMKPGTNIIKWENNWGLSEILGPQSTHLSNWKAFDLNMNATRFVNVGAKFKFTTGSRDSYFFKENKALDSLLTFLKVPHEFAIRNEIHPELTKNEIIELVNYFDSSFVYGSGMAAKANIKTSKAFPPKQMKRLDKKLNRLEVGDSDLRGRAKKK